MSWLKTQIYNTHTHKHAQIIIINRRMYRSITTKQFTINANTEHRGLLYTVYQKGSHNASVYVTTPNANRLSIQLFH